MAEAVQSSYLKRRFYVELEKVCSGLAQNCIYLSDENYSKNVNAVKNAKTTPKKEPRDYRLLPCYDAIFIQNKPKLIFPMKEANQTGQFFVKDSIFVSHS